MKLRYLRVGNYPPLKEVRIALAGASPIDRQCAIRFVVGVNGSGKSHLLQAISEAFLALADWRVPHFPVTMVYELRGEPAFTFDLQKLSSKDAVLSAGTRKTVIIAASRTTSQPQPSLWVSESHVFNPEAKTDDFESLIDSLYRTKKQTHYRPVIAPNQWTGAATPQLAYLPDTVLAYTTGAQEPWRNIWARNGNAGGIDLLIEDQEAIAESERPAGWSLERELKEGTAASPLTQDDSDYGTALGWKPILITPELLKFALLAVALPAALSRLTPKKNAVKTDKGLSELLTRADWDYPTSVSLTMDFNPKAWSEATLRRILPWLEAAGEITGEPEPGKQRFLHFDLLGRLNQISDADTRKYLAGETYQGEALLSLLNDHTDATAYERFERLYALHHQGLFKNLQICLRKKGTDDLILYDELSDGEQMILGRMALFHLLKDRPDALLLLDEPETHFNDVWKREIVDIVDDAMSDTTSEVIIATHSAIVLTDAMSRDIVLLERTDGKDSEIRQVKGELQTFGATIDHPLRDVFGSPDTVGKRATIILETLLAACEDQIEIEKYWQSIFSEKSGLANKLFDSIKRSQPSRHEWTFDAGDVETALNQIKHFAEFYGVNHPFRLEALLSVFIDHMGPGYFKIELMKAWRKIRNHQ